jgi:hypothetical protein
MVEKLISHVVGVSCYCLYTQQKQCPYKVTLRRVRLTTVYRGKAISITYSECVPVALVTETVRLYHIFPHYHITEWKDFRGKNIIEHETCVLIVSTSSVCKMFHFRKT